MSGSWVAASDTSGTCGFNHRRWRLPPGAEAQQRGRPTEFFVCEELARGGGRPRGTADRSLWIKFRKSQDSSRRPAAGCRQLAGERGLLGGRSGSLGIANPETSWPAEAKANSEHTSPAQPLVKLFILGPTAPPAFLLFHSRPAFLRLKGLPRNLIPLVNLQKGSARKIQHSDAEGFGLLERRVT